MAEDSRKRLLEYYKLLMSDDNGQIDDKKEETLDYIVGSLKDSTVDVEVKAFDVEVRKQQEDRLKKYAELLGNSKLSKAKVDFEPEYGFVVKGENEDIQIEFEKSHSDIPKRIVKYAISSMRQKNVLEELTKAYSDVDLENEITIEVNGNKFTYNKNKINIDEYMDELIQIGNEKKGCSWDVDFDEDGELIFVC